MAKKVIKLLGEPIQNEDSQASEAITPGHLVEIHSTSSIRRHATAAGAAARNFALDRVELGDDIDTPYAIGDTVKVGAFPPGSRVNAIIASGQNIARGAFLESAGDGTLRVYASGVRLGVALESVNNSAGPSAARLRTEVL